MNISSNPWSFISTDIQASATAAASPTGMVANAQDVSSVTLTTTGAHGFSVNQYLTYISDTNSRFLGWYKVIAVPTTTTALLAWLSTPTLGSPPATVPAASGGGTMLVNQIQQNVRIEDISLQATSATPGTGAIILLDRNGNPEWTAWQLTAGTGVGATPPAQNRGKLMWVDGMTWQTMPTNIMALVTIN